MNESFAIAPTTGAGLQDWGVLTVEQEIRARALDAAIRWAALPWLPVATEEQMENLVTDLADYIRDGEAPKRFSAEERSDDPSNASKIAEEES